MNPPVTRQTTAQAAVKQASRRRKAADGWVAFVGAGPGDEGLLTVRAAELLGQADLVVAAP